jgi:hypothetical protein
VIEADEGRRLGKRKITGAVIGWIGLSPNVGTRRISNYVESS